jgi:hypothetical protein
MPTPSEKAMRLVCMIAPTIEDTGENSPFELGALTIDTALNEARLEGAKAMQEAATNKGYIQGWIYEKTKELSPDTFTPHNISLAIEALDPQQVINERK